MDTREAFAILVVDDDNGAREVNARLLRRLGYEVGTAEDGVSALAKLGQGFDLVIVDGDMPHVDGFEVAQRIREDVNHRHLPIVMVTGLVAPDYRRRALSIGINDFISKPVDPGELELRTKWLLRLKRAEDVIAGQRANLTGAMASGTEELRRTLEEVAEAERQTRQAHADTVHRLMVAAEYKDPDTAGHIGRIGLYSELVASALQMEPRTVELIRYAATMHDLGKIGIPDRVLLKPGPLDGEEWVIMRSHTSIGEQILAGSDSPLLQMGERIAASHHERWDGHGYPNGLSGDAIPLEGRICAVADFFDALTMNRPYRAPVAVNVVIGMMQERSGAHFDPAVLEAFLGVIAEVNDIRQRVR